MASLALGLAGAGIGSFFGPLGTSLGWSAGVMLGGRLGRKSHQSPQLKDLRVQTSEYGTAIPIGFGTIRISGWLEWAADKVPHKNKQGGKGGPKVTTTTYTCSFAIGLLETSFLDGDGILVNNPIAGILRIWANGRLVFGEGSPADAWPMTIYYGTEEQLPDPTIEAAEGAGQVSANRGKAYVVFTDLELAQFGDAIPNFTFEVVASGDIALSWYSTWPVDYDYPDDSLVFSYPLALNGVAPVSTDGTFKLHRYRAGSAYGPPFDLDNVIYYDQSTYDLNGALLGTETQLQTAFNTSGVGVYGSLNSGIAFVRWQESADCGDGVESFNTFAWMKDGVVTYTPAPLCSFGETELFLPIQGAPVLFNGNVYAAGQYIIGVDDIKIRRWPAPDGAVYTRDADPFEFNADAVNTFYPSVTADAGCICVGDDGYIYWLVGYYALGDGTRLFKFDTDLNLLATWWDGSGASLPSSGVESMAVFRGHLVAYRSAGIVLSGVPCFVMHRLNSDGTTTFVAEVEMSEGAVSGASPVIYVGGGLAAVRGGILTLGSGTITLAEMVANVSQHVGYADDEYDVSQLTDVVRGACISQRTSGRAAIEAWQPAYQFGAVESNFANKFVKWGGEVDVIIPDADLGAREYGTGPGDPIRRTLITDKDLPRTVEVVFLNKAMDYQEGMQYWEGPVASDLHVALSMALVFTDTEGKAIAENIGVNALVERNRFAFQLPRKYADLEPTDVIAINEQAIRITSKDEQGYTHIACEGISTRIGEWIVAPVAPQTSYVPQAPPTQNRTDAFLLDLPLIQDADFPNGFYGSFAGRTSASWPGAGLYKSIDGGATYESIAAIVNADTFGVALTVLGDFTGGNIFDEGNTLTVRLSPGSGELASSNEVGVLNGANVFALGSDANGYEVAQFKTAVLIASNEGGSKTYTLSGLLRGRRGTDWAIGSHGFDDKFFLLPNHNIEGLLAELGQERHYKAVTFGGVLSSATAIAFTNNGVALECYAPCELGGGRNGAGDITLVWQRRTRAGGAWVDYVDAPLSEATEWYELTIYADSAYTTIKNVIDGENPSAIYSAAQQVADFGAPQPTLYWGVKQLGAYGWGREAQGVT